MKVPRHISIKSLLVATAMAASFFCGYSLRPDPIQIEPIVVEYTSLVEFELGDLVPCEKELAEYELKICGLIDDKQVHIWKEWFCVYDGVNTDPTKRDTMYEGSICACGPANSFSGSTNIVELSSSSVEINVDWLVTELGESSGFTAILFIQPNNIGEIRLDQKRSIKWKMKSIDKTAG